MSGYPNKIVLKIGRGAYLLRLSLQFAGSEYSRKLCCVNSNFLSIPAADFPRVLSTFSMYVTVHSNVCIPSILLFTEKVV